jgi:hypothetical protein
VIIPYVAEEYAGSPPAYHFVAGLAQVPSPAPSMFTDCNRGGDDCLDYEGSIDPCNKVMYADTSIHSLPLTASAAQKIVPEHQALKV